MLGRHAKRTRVELYDPSIDTAAPPGRPETPAVGPGSASSEHREAKAPQHFNYREKEKLIADLNDAHKNIAHKDEEKAERAAELMIANAELAYQTKEKGMRAAELVLANVELAFQTREKGKRAAELVLANEELVIQTDE
jgi:hypothetical protein